ncbi:hypothetical protein BDV12DRAFT_168289, partial [Aspergillus spectabilis]
MADPPNMSLSEIISVAIQFTKSHIVQDRLVGAEEFAQTLSRVTNAQKSRDAIQVPGDPLSKDGKIKTKEYNLAIQLQLITKKLEELSNGELEGENRMAQLCETVRQTAEEYIECLADSKSPLPHMHTNAVSSTAIAGCPGLMTKPSTDNMLQRSLEGINSLNLGTVVAKNGAQQTIVFTSGGQFKLGNVESTGGSAQFVGSPLDMKPWTENHYH